MEVILKQDVKNLGYAHDVVKVRNGYGLNYLIPQGMAVIANDTNRKINSEVMRQRQHSTGVCCSWTVKGRAIRAMLASAWASMPVTPSQVVTW